MSDGNIFNTRGVHVAIVRGPAIFDLKGKKLYDLKGINIYKPSGDLVGHLANSEGADKHLDKATDTRSDFHSYWGGPSLRSCTLSRLALLNTIA